MLRPEPTDIILILIAAALLIYGPKRIPERARLLGSSIHEFREGLKGKEERDTAKKPDDKNAEVK